MIVFIDFYLVGNPLRIVIPGGVGPPCDSKCDGFGVVNRTPGRFPIPFGKINLKFAFEPVPFEGDDFSFDSDFSCDAESSDAAFALKPGGSKALISFLNETLFNTLSKLLEPESFAASGISVVVVDFGSLYPGGKNLPMSSIVVFGNGRFVVIVVTELLSFGDLKPGGKNLLISSVTVLKWNGALVVACLVDGL